MERQCVICMHVRHLAGVESLLHAGRRRAALQQLARRRKDWQQRGGCLVCGKRSRSHQANGRGGVHCAAPCSRQRLARSPPAAVGFRDGHQRSRQRGDDSAALRRRMRARKGRVPAAAACITSQCSYNFLYLVVVVQHRMPCQQAACNMHGTMQSTPPVHAGAQISTQCSLCSKPRTGIVVSHSPPGAQAVHLFGCCSNGLCLLMRVCANQASQPLSRECQFDHVPSRQE
jgi:hypothetical protein